MIFSKNDVVVVPFPFTDKAKSKKRPALVISSKDFCRKSGHAVLAMITTKGKWPFDLEISELTTTGLNVSCRVRMKLFTLDLSLIAKKIGELGRQDRHHLEKNLRECL